MAKKPVEVQNLASLSLNLKVAGLYTNPSAISTNTPPGKLSIAKNVVLRKPEVIEKRRGFAKFGDVFPDVDISTQTLFQGFNYQDKQLWTFSLNRIAYDTKAKSSGTIAVVDYSLLTGAILTIGTETLTEGVEWTAATSNAVTTTSLLNACKAIDYNNGDIPVLFTKTSDTALAVEAVFFGAFFNAIVLTSDDGTNLPVSGAGTLTGGIDPGTWATLTGTLPDPGFSDRFRIIKHYGIEAAKNFYITSGEGTKKLDDVTGTIKHAGGLPGLDGTAVTDASGSGFMDDQTQVAYRIIWAHPDENHADGIVGTPSQRVICINDSGASQNVDLIVTIPDGITTSSTYRIYRSAMSATVSTPPDDELQLVLEGEVSSGDITATFFSVTDSTTESLRGASLYTNNSQEGIAQANNIPPASVDITNFKGFTIYSDIKTQQKFSLTMLSVGASEGVQVDDTVAIILTDSGTTYTFTGKASEDASAGEFKVDTSGTPAENIEATSLSLVRVINRSQLLASNVNVYAFYESGSTDLPGQIRLQEWNAEGTDFTLVSSRSTPWSPALPTSSGPSSTQSGEQHQLLVSKEDQPEAVPLANKLSIGSENFPIYRTIALRDSTIVLKGDGIFRLTGTSFPFQVTAIDNTVFITAIDSARSSNNFVYAYTNKGYVQITDTSSPEVISIPIDNILKEIALNENFFLSTSGFTYETEYEVGLLYTLSPNSLVATNAIIYNTVTKEWYDWEFPVPVWSAQVDPTDNQMYLASADDDLAYVYRERKGRNSSDYADDQLQIDIVSSSEFSVEVASTTGIVLGDTIAQFDDTNDLFTISELTGRSILPLHTAIVTDIPDGTHVTVDTEVSWDADNTQTYAYTPFEWRIKSLPNPAGNAGVLKRFQRWEAFFADIDITNIQTTLTTNLSPLNESLDSIPFIPVNLTGWGGVPWGDGPWGGETKDVPLYVLRGDVERNACRGHVLNIDIINEEALASIDYLGTAISYYPMTQTMRGFA